MTLPVIFVTTKFLEMCGQVKMGYIGSNLHQHSFFFRMKSKHQLGIVSIVLKYLSPQFSLKSIYVGILQAGFPPQKLWSKTPPQLQVEMIHVCLAMLAWKRGHQRLSDLGLGDK